MTDVLSPSLPKTGKRYHSSQEYFPPIDKKSKYIYDNGDLDCDMSFSENVQHTKKSRSEESVHFQFQNTNNINVNTINMDPRYLEFQHYEALNKSLHELNSRKNNEISQLLMKLTNMEKLNSTLTEENKLLKKAVTVINFYFI